jgi:predicted enzyme related to lactoylglutathione lyase
MHGTFAWNELASTDIEKARAFYAETLGWAFQEFPLPSGSYWVAMAGDKVVAGLGGMETASLPGETSSHWFSFIEVDDVDARVEKAVALGATVLDPPTDVPNVGRVAVLRDPTGAAIGWMTGLKSDPASTP